MLALDRLTPPWIHRVALEPGARVETALRAPGGFALRVLDGRRCRTKAGLLGELTRALALPDTCARNWDALEEGLADLDGLPADGYVVAVTGAEHLLADAPSDYDTFIRVVEDVAREWATPRSGQWPRPAKPFHLVLLASGGRKPTRASARRPRTER